MQRKTCWFFGDSFTRGNGCHFQDDYYVHTHRAEFKRWTTAISEALGMVEKNTAVGGESNAGILHTLISNLNKIQKGDKVILGDTRPIRILSFDESGNKVNTINDPYFNYTQGNSKFILDYIYYEIAPKEEFYLDFYQKSFGNILRELENRGVSTYFWKHTGIWYPDSVFETITTATKGKIHNLHWSWKGHSDMTAYILNEIEKNSTLI